LQSVITADYDLQNFLLKRISKLSSKQNKSISLKTRVFKYLLSNSYCSDFSQAAVAANFNTSPRNLQKKLKDEGSSFQRIVESVRKSLALDCLNSGDYPLKDISNILGYNEVSSFSRAFKRWTNKTPNEVRNSSRNKLYKKTRQPY
jgi:AraC-like DNA-binding protein